MAKLEPRYGEIIPMSAQSSPALIHPVTTSLAEGLYVSGPIYSQLVRYDPLVHRGAEIIGDVAKSWEVSDDGLVYTFRLHENVRFTDGEDLDADDVAFTINHILEPGAARPVTGKLRPYVDRAEKIDKYTVAIHLKFPTSAFIKILAIDFMKIMPQHVIEAGVDLELFENMVGSGPFKGVSYTVGNNWEHEKNPDYFREGLPYFDGLHTFFIADEGTEIAAYRTERVLMNTDPLNNLDSEDGLRLEKDPDFSSKFDIWWMPPGVPVYLVMNTKAAPFDDERVRRAIILGFDRTLLTDGFGLGKFTVGMPMHPEYNQFALPREEVMQAPGWRQGPDGGNHPDDIAEAKRLLKEAGFDENNPLKAKFNVPTVIFLGDAGQVIQDQLKTDIGVELEFVVGEVSTIIVDMFTGNYQIGLLGEANIFFDPDDRFAFNYIEGRNLAQWDPPDRVMELYRQQQREPDFEKRKQLNWEMQRLVVDGAPGLLDYSYFTFGTIVSKRIKTAIGHYSQSTSIYQRIARHELEWLEPK
jgi:peptide/nickel transport system substrate-binding protein